MGYSLQFHAVVSPRWDLTQFCHRESVVKQTTNKFLYTLAVWLTRHTSPDRASRRCYQLMDEEIPVCVWNERWQGQSRVASLSWWMSCWHIRLLAVSTLVLCTPANQDKWLPMKTAVHFTLTFMLCWLQTTRGPHRTYHPSYTVKIN